MALVDLTEDDAAWEVKEEKGGKVKVKMKEEGGLRSVDALAVAPEEGLSRLALLASRLEELRSTPQSIVNAVTYKRAESKISVCGFPFFFLSKDGFQLLLSGRQTCEGQLRMRNHRLLKCRDWLQSVKVSGYVYVAMLVGNFGLDVFAYSSKKFAIGDKDLQKYWNSTSAKPLNNEDEYMMDMDTKPVIDERQAVGNLENGDETNVAQLRLKHRDLDIVQTSDSGWFVSFVDAPKLAFDLVRRDRSIFTLSCRGDRSLHKAITDALRNSPALSDIGEAMVDSAKFEYLWLTLTGAYSILQIHLFRSVQAVWTASRSRQSIASQS